MAGSAGAWLDGHSAARAVGHGFGRWTLIARALPAFSGKIGQQVASPLCTVVDNGTLAGLRGSLNVDDEGTPTQENIPIENGVLKGYIQTGSTEGIDGRACYGQRSSRKLCAFANAAHDQYSMKAGDDLPEDIISSG